MDKNSYPPDSDFFNVARESWTTKLLIYRISFPRSLNFEFECFHDKI